MGRVDAMPALDRCGCWCAAERVSLDFTNDVRRYPSAMPCDVLSARSWTSEAPTRPAEQSGGSPGLYQIESGSCGSTSSAN